MKLKTINPKDYKISHYGEEDIWLSYQRIQDFLKLKFDGDVEYLALLAKPQKKINKIQWESNYLSNAQEMSLLSEKDKGACLQKLTELLETIQREILDSPEWQELFSKILQTSREDDVYYDVALDRVTLINWGASPLSVDDSKPYAFKVTQKGTIKVPHIEQKSKTDFENNGDENKTKLEDVSSFAKEIKKEVEEATETSSPDNEHKEVPKQAPEPNLEEEVKPKELPNKEESPITEEEMNQKPNDKAEQVAEVEQEGSDKRAEEELASVDEESNHQNTTNTGSLTEASFSEELSFWDKYKKFLKPFLLVGGLLALGLLLYNLFAHNPLPKEAGVLVPIEEGDIDLDDDSIRSIVTNRLNICVEDEGRLEDFMKDFSETYSDKEYEIIYYDTIVQRLQIRLPKEERVALKEELNAKFPKYKLLIWEEDVYDADFSPQDPDFKQGDNSWYFSCVGAYSAWDKGLGNDKLIVAIVDGGFDLNHPELKDRVVDQYNVCDRKHKVSIHHHGTHVAATAVGSINNASGVSGIAPNCALMAIQVADKHGQMTETAIIDGVLYAIHHGAKVVNLSLGANFGPAFLNLSYAEQVMFMKSNSLDQEKLWNKIYAMGERYGVTIVWAGGNDNLLIGLDACTRSSRAIKVSAIDKSLSKADFSNYGFLSTVSAPGVEIYNAYPNNEYKAIQGTSMAAPIVTGAIALIKSRQPNLTTGQIAELLRRTGIPAKGDVGPIIQIDKALEIVNTDEDLSTRLPDPNEGVDPGKALPPYSPRYPGGEKPERPVGPIRPDDPLKPFYPPIGQPRQPRPGTPNDPCQDVQTRIDSLEAVIRNLRRSCQDPKEIPDTLRLSKDIKLQDLTGYWKSTTDLYNERTNEPIELIFQIKADGTGAIEYREVNSGNTFLAETNVALKDQELVITQLEDASNPQYPNQGWSQYLFVGKANRKSQVAECVATLRAKPKLKLVYFNMVRISQ